MAGVTMNDLMGGNWLKKASPAKPKPKQIKVGGLVAFNNLQDAVWFEVLAIDGFDLTVREEKTEYAPQKIDKSLVKQVR